MRLVIALGGNALITKKEKGTYGELVRNIQKTCRLLAHLSQKYDMVVVSGSGPQIGALLLQNELARHKVPPMPLDVLDAQLEGELGYLLSQNLTNELRKNKIKKAVATILTQVLVDKNDKAFKNPSKPIGIFYTKNEAEKLRRKGAHIINDAGRGYRRVVASPKPIKIIESDIIRRLIQLDTVVIACGGGGIPVVTRGNKLRGIEAVIDKDFTSSCLGRKIKASLLLILTSVPFVYLNYNKINQKVIKKMNVTEARKYSKENHFGIGSMKPKIEAAIDFLVHGGKKVVITNLEHCLQAIRGEYGTLIMK